MRLASTSLTAPGSKVTFTYDAMDRLLVQSGPETDVRVGYTYDDAGRVVKMTSPNGMASTVVDDFTTSVTYDLLDRVTKTTRWTAAGTALKVKAEPARTPVLRRGG